jgi:hypothetical protein
MRGPAAGCAGPVLTQVVQHSTTNRSRQLAPPTAYGTAFPMPMEPLSLPLDMCLACSTGASTCAVASFAMYCAGLCCKQPVGK